MTPIKSVASISLSRCNQGSVRLQIEDQHSGDRILEINMTPEELGLLITGLSGIKGKMDYFPNAMIGKKRKIIHETCDKVVGDKEGQIQAVQDDFLSKYNIGTHSIQSNGVGTQQPNKQHQYIVKYYEDVEDVLDVKRYY
jgi:hypothetical protein